MKHKRNILLPVLAIPALVAFSTPGDQVEFHPSGGTTVTKTYVNESELSLDELSVVMNGQEIDPSMMGDIEQTISSSVEISVTDEYVSVADGRLTKLIRSFDEIAMSTSISSSNEMMGDTDMDMTGASELTGKKVVFQWDADAGEYRLSFHEDASGDEELLEELDVDMDLRGLLPDGEVAEGDTWEIDPESLREILAPGGSLKLEPEEMESEMGFNPPQPSPDEMIGELNGEVKGEFGGTREEEGVQVAVIKLTWDIASAKDLSELMADMMDSMDTGDMEVGIEWESFDMEFEYQAEGVLLWNVQAGIAHSLEVSGESTLIMDMSMNMSMSGMEQAIEQSATMAGSNTIRIEFGS